MGSKSPTAVSKRMFKGEKHDLGAAAPFSTTMLSLQGRAGGSTFTPKVTGHIGPGSTRLAAKLSPCIACTASTSLSVRSRDFVFNGPSASMVRRGYRASCSRPAKRCLITLISSESSSILRESTSILSKGLFTHFSCFSNLSSRSRHPSASLG